jgi:hypothetical protein
MSLVTRIRDCLSTDPRVDTEGEKLLREAADEIERLSAYAEELRTALVGAAFGLMWIARNGDKALPEWARSIAADKLAQADAALAKNPNPSGQPKSEPSQEGSGPVGLGPYLDAITGALNDLEDGFIRAAKAKLQAVLAAAPEPPASGKPSRLLQAAIDTVEEYRSGSADGLGTCIGELEAAVGSVLAIRNQETCAKCGSADLRYAAVAGGAAVAQCNKCGHTQ